MSNNTLSIGLTMTRQPPRWHFWLARVFGKKFYGSDDNCVVYGYHWRGKLYVTKVRFK